MVLELDIQVLNILQHLLAHRRGDILAVLDELKLNYYFESIVAFEDVDRPKPEPDVYLKNADNMHVDPDECVVFEDSIAGLTAAKRAGMHCVALATTQPKEKLAEADLIIDNFYDISVERLDELK